MHRRFAHAGRRSRVIVGAEQDDQLFDIYSFRLQITFEQAPLRKAGAADAAVDQLSRAFAGRGRESAKPGLAPVPSVNKSPSSSSEGRPVSTSEF